jgi:hypothetical protein
MPDFSTIIQTPEIRAIVQEGFLERAFHDALFPGMIFRQEAVAMPWPQGVGDTYIASAPGLIAPNGKPLAPGVDPVPVSYALEQWEAQLHNYASTIDVNMQTSVQAIVDLLMRNTHQLGLQAAQTLNRLVRNRLYNAAESGRTVANGAGVASTSLRVMRLNGFTRARNPSTTGASKVRFSTVSATNPLAITIGASTSASVVGYTPDTPGDEIGPGVLTLAAAATWSNRDAVVAVDASEVTYVGGGTSVDSIATTDLPRLQDIRNALYKLRRNNIPVHPDGTYHAHLGPVSETALMADAELQRMNQGTGPANYMYAEFALGSPFLGVTWVRNNEAPTRLTVYPGDGVTFAEEDAFAPELYATGATTGAEVHRILFTGFGGIMEYFQDPMMYLTDAGITGKIGDLAVSNNGIDVSSDRVKLIIRAPQNRLQDTVAVSWRFVGDWPQRTDAATGTNARYKRQSVLLHGYDG